MGEVERESIDMKKPVTTAQGKVDKVMQRYKYLGVWAEMEMTSRTGGSVGEYKE